MDQDLQNLTDRVTALEQQSFGVNPAIHPVTQQNLEYQVGLLSTSSSSINGRSHNSTTQSIPINSGGSPTLLTLDTSDFANGITWDSTTHLFTCITAGIYMVTCTIALNTGSIQSGDSYTASVYKNASAAVSWIWASNLQGLQIGCTDLVSLAIGDTVSFYVTLGGNGAMTINAATGAISKQ